MPVYSTKKKGMLYEAEKDDSKSIHHGANLTFELTPLDDIPKDYYRTAAKLFQTIKDTTEDRVGEGVWDAFTNSIFSKKSKEDIENATNKNAFVFIIPRRLSVALWSTPKKWEEFADGILRKAGFKEGKADTIAVNTRYWYKYSPDKKSIYVAFYLTPVGYVPVSYQLQLSIRCVTNTEKNAFVYENGVDYNPNRILTESQFNESMDKTVDRIKRNEAIKEKRKHDALVREQSAQEIASKQALGSIFDASKEDGLEFDSLNIRKYIPYPELEKTFVEYFDCRDQVTRRKLMAMTEAEHNSTLTNLTSKLYDQIVKKAHNIDYGEIPKTKGDIGKLSNYEDLMDTLGIIRGIVKEYKQDTKPVDEISVAVSNLSGRKDMFERAFRYDCELPMLMYNNLVLAVIAGVSFMITSCIEFIKAPRDETFTIQLDKVAYNKSKDALLYNSLSKFNKSCESGDFDKAMNLILDKKIRKFTGIAIGTGIIAGIVLLVNIIPLLRELTYFFFYVKNNISDFFAVQADLLTMNAYNVRRNEALDDAEKDDIVEKQLAIASKFRDVSNKFAIDRKKAEVEATRDIEKSGKKYKLDQNADIVAEDDDDGSDTSVLF